MSEPLKISVHVEEKRYQPTQEKTVVPDWDAKTVTPDKGYALSKVTVEGMPEPTESETFTENGTYDVGRIGTAVVDVEVNLQDKTVTPTEQTQTIEADAGYDGIDTVTVNPIPPEYVVPTGSVDISANGTVPVAGKATANVNVPQGVFPAGTKLITQNVTGEDVTNYERVDVAVPGPTGTKQISITANGTTTEDVSDYADAEITVNTLPAKGLVFEDYDSDGYPHSARFVGTWTDIPATYCAWFGFDGSFAKKVTHIIIPDGVKRILNSAFYGIPGLKTVEFPASLEGIGQNAFASYSGTNRADLYDFSHCSVIPSLFSVASLSHASGCVIRIPAALSDTTLGEGNGWESATNWSALTGIVWEVV